MDARTLKKGMRIFVAGKLVQRTWQDDSCNKRQTVEIQVTHVGPDLQFATAEVESIWMHPSKVEQVAGQPRARVGRGRSQNVGKQPKAKRRRIPGRKRISST
jgi:single-stranded DNA-binding protein